MTYEISQLMEIVEACHVMSTDYTRLYVNAGWQKDVLPKTITEVRQSITRYRNLPEEVQREWSKRQKMDIAKLEKACSELENNPNALIR